MTDRSASDVAASCDGLSGLGIIRFEGRYRRSFGPSADAFSFAVRLVPKEPDSQLIVKLNRVYLKRLKQIPLGAPADENEDFE